MSFLIRGKEADKLFLNFLFGFRDVMGQVKQSSYATSFVSVFFQRLRSQGVKNQKGLGLYQSLQV
jgi:hypothetical protein